MQTKYFIRDKITKLEFTLSMFKRLLTNAIKEDANRKSKSTLQRYLKRKVKEQKQLIIEHKILYALMQNNTS